MVSFYSMYVYFEMKIEYNAIYVKQLMGGNFSVGFGFIDH